MPFTFFYFHSFLKKILSLTIFIFTFFWLATVCKWYLGDFFYAISQKNNSLNPAKLAVNFDPENPNFSINLANLYADENQPNQTIFYLNQTFHHSPYEINFYKQASTAYTKLAIHNLIYINQAIANLQTAANFAPTDAILPYQLGNIYKATNDQTNAEKYYQKALQLKPNYDHAMLQLGQLYFEQKKYAKAKVLFESAVKINPKNSQSLPSFPLHL